MNKLKKMSKNLFSLIELIVVVVVLGVLSAIVIPNISSFKGEAEKTAIISDVKNIQTAADLYSLKNNGDTPTKETPTLGNPQTIELYGMKPDYLRDVPKTIDKTKFWLDHSGTVWASMVDAPKNVNYTTGKLSWDTVDGAILYKIYKSKDSITASSKEFKGMEFIENVTPSIGLTQEKTISSLSTGTYLITAVDVFDFESAPTKVNTLYDFYKQPSKDFLPNQFINPKPIVEISMSPENKIKTNTIITWGYDTSNYPNQVEIDKVEWKLNSTLVDSLPNTLTQGENIIDMRVQDKSGFWSDWVSKTIFVEEFVELSQSFTYTGIPQEYVIPETGVYKLETWGAQGGNVPNTFNVSSKGGYAYGETTFTKGEKIYIFVGQQPTSSLTVSQYNVGGWNGGGNGYNWDQWNRRSGGGGATDIRKVNGAWNNSTSLNSRIIVAGGAGGTGANTDQYGTWHEYSNNQNISFGGGLIGGTGYPFANTGGTSSRGGVNNSTYLTSAEKTTSAGILGRGGNSPSTRPYSGGGGGLYGGAADHQGAGGSSYIGGLTNSGTLPGERSGHGMAKITLVDQ